MRPNFTGFPLMTRRKVFGSLVVLAGGLAVGCSNAPVAGFLDNCFPSKARTEPPSNPGPSVEPGGGGGGAPKGKSDDKLPPPDFGANP